MPGPWGLLTTGFARKIFVDIRNSMYSAIRQLWSPDVDLSDDSPTAIRLQVAALEDDMLWKAEESVFYSAYIPTASGVSLDYLGQWLGLERFRAAVASGPVKLVGAANTVIPAGTRVFATDGAVFSLVEDVTIPASGVADTYVIAERAGAEWNKAPGTIEAIEFSGVTVSNGRERHTYYVVPGPGAGFVEIPPDGSLSNYQVISAGSVAFLTDIDGFAFAVKNVTDTQQEYWIHLEIHDNSPRLLARSQTKILELAPGETKSVVYESQLINGTELRGQQFRLVFVNEERSSASIGVEVSAPDSQPRGFYRAGVRQNYDWKVAITSRLVGDIRGGRSVEEDYEYRQRLLRATFRPARATPSAIVSRLQGIFDIRHVLFNENVYERDERPLGGLRPKSVGLVIAGGFIPEIAATIADSVSAGIALDGTDIYPVLHNQFGYVRPVSFVRPVPVPISLTIEIQRRYDFPADGVTVLKDALVAYIGGEDSRGTMRPGLGPGTPVILAEIIDRVMDIPGVRDCKVTLGREGGLPGSQNIPIGTHEIAETRPDLIEVS